jgi:hypothetical protein
MRVLTRHFLIWLAVLTGWLSTADTLRGQLPREYDVKAVFLYNFVSFVTWPDSAFADANTPFVIGVLGHDPFGPVLDEVVRSEQAKNRALVVKRMGRVEEATDCHILFISGSEGRRVPEILRKQAGRPTLLVGDFPGFAEAGGMVGFRMEGSRLKLDINVDAARAANLAISSKLLRVARVIGKEGANDMAK